MRDQQLNWMGRIKWRLSRFPVLVDDWALWWQVAVTVLVLCWALRLGSFLFMRVLAAGKDSRFDEIKDKPCVLCPPSSK